MITERFMFTEVWIKRLSPDYKGVYIFFNHCGEILYIGKSGKSILSDLLNHVANYPDNQKISYFSLQFELNPTKKATDLLNAYSEVYNRLPVMNEFYVKV